MDAKTVEIIKSNPKFRELVDKRKSFSIMLSIIVLAIYFGFILVIAFNPALFGTKLGDDTVTTLGIPVGLGIIIACIALTGVYVSRANSEFDELTNSIKNSVSNASKGKK